MVKNTHYLFAIVLFILGNISPLFAKVDCTEPSALKLKVWNDDLPASYKTSLTGGTLPVELEKFWGNFEDDKVSLKWTTASEINNEGFDIQCSGTGTEWNSIGFVSGQGTTFERQNYYFEDVEPKPGLTYYRLNQIDFDGVSEMSNTISVSVSNRNKDSKLFPNPALGEEINLELYFSDEETVQVVITDQLGKRVYQSDYSAFEGTNSLAIPIPDLPKGTYFVELVSKHQSFAPMPFQKQ